MSGLVARLKGRREAAGVDEITALRVRHIATCERADKALTLMLQTIEIHRQVPVRVTKPL